MGVNCNICSNKCLGFEGNHGGCCTLGDRNFIIGPHYDVDSFMKKLQEKFGRKIDTNEIFVFYEEGKNLFPDKAVWQNEKGYPALRVDILNSKLPCIFYNTNLRACMIYDIRPEICRNFECDYLSQNS